MYVCMHVCMYVQDILNKGHSLNKRHIPMQELNACSMLSLSLTHIHEVQTSHCYVQGCDPVTTSLLHRIETTSHT